MSGTTYARVGLSETEAEGVPSSSSAMGRMFGSGHDDPWSLSKLLFLWASPLIERGNALKKGERLSLLSLPEEFASDQVYAEFRTHWADAPSGFAVPTGMRLSTSLHALILVDFWTAGLFRALSDVSVFISALLIKQIVRASDDDDVASIVMFAFLIGINGLVGSVALQQFIHGCFLCGNKVVSASNSICYHAILNLRMHRLNPVRTVGEINNIQSKDSSELREFVAFAHNLWACPLLLVACVVLLLHQLGLAGLVSCVLLPLLLPIEAAISKRSRVVRKEALKKADVRMGSVYELIDGIKTVKFTGWGLESHIDALREDELESLWHSSMIAMGNTVLTSSSTLVVTLATFAVYSLLHGSTIQADQAFSSLVIIGIIGRPMKLIPKCISLLADARVSCARIEDLMSQAEAFYSPPDDEGAREDGMGVQMSPLTVSATAPSSWRASDAASVSSLSLLEATATRPPADAVVLSRVSLPLAAAATDNSGSNLVVITGDIASGKTALLLAVLGELDIKGRHRGAALPARPMMAYVAHEPWILNASVRDNIFFVAPPGPSSEEAYQRALEACCLSVDLDAWADRDGTIIGEKGVNISGGQRQRIALARSLLSPAPVLLLDSPLSGLDIHVADQVFTRAVLSAAQSRLVLMTTHNPAAYAPHAARVVVLRNGLVAFDGAANAYFAWASAAGSLQQSGQGEGAAAAAAKQIVPLPEKALPDSQGVGKGQGRGKADIKGKDGNAEKDSDVSASHSLVHTLSLYASAANRGTIFLAVVLTCLAFASGALADFLLAQWTNGTLTAAAYLELYSFVSLCVVGLNAGRYFVYALVGLTASKSYHSRLLRSVAGATMDFFNRPSGRITSRFSSDIDVIDNAIPSSLSSLADSFFGIITGVGMVMIGNPLYIFVAVPLTYKYYSVQALYRTSSKELKNIDSASKSPLYSHFRETLSGLETLRAFGPHMQRRMLRKHYALLDASIAARMNWDATNRWLGIRLEIIGSLIVTAAAFSLLLLHTDVLFSPHRVIHGADADGKKGGTAGLMLSYALKATQSLTFFIRASTALENMLTSCDRVDEYINVEQEEEGVVVREGQGGVEARDKLLLPSGDVESPHSIASDGDVVLEVASLSARYLPSLPPSLRHVSLSLRRGSLTAVAGRTGSGKSTLAAAVLRAVPRDSGAVLLGGRDVCTFPLREYRQKVQLYPQDSFVFSGTLGAFLDPAGIHGEPRVNALLRELLLSTAATEEQTASSSPSSSATLDCRTTVTAGGNNLSEGERQCVVLARCCLCSAQVVVLDEITSNLGQRSSEAALNIVKRELCGRGAAVLFISHRACDLLLCDRVVVLRGGSLVHEGSPAAMLQVLSAGEV